jgi:hypothetical protein
MATSRGSASTYDVGNKPPMVSWTVVRGDTAAFKMYVTDDVKQPLTIEDWTISMKVKRPVLATQSGVITDNATTILTLTPAADEDDLIGEFTVSLTAAQSIQLETGDIFDIQLASIGNAIVWTVAQGKMIILEDVTD